MTAVIGVLDPETWEPPVAKVSCGLRKDLFKAHRHHLFLDAGKDARINLQTGERRVRRILICDRCGREKDVR